MVLLTSYLWKKSFLLLLFNRVRERKRDRHTQRLKYDLILFNQMESRREILVDKQRKGEIHEHTDLNTCYDLILFNEREGDRRRLKYML